MRGTSAIKKMKNMDFHTISFKEILEVFEIVDVDNSQTVPKTDFANLLIAALDARPKSDLAVVIRNLVEEMDHDYNGLIDPHEMYEKLCSGDTAIQTLVLNLQGKQLSTSY